MKIQLHFKSFLLLAGIQTLLFSCNDLFEDEGPRIYRGEIKVDPMLIAEFDTLIDDEHFWPQTCVGDTAKYFVKVNSSDQLKSIRVNHQNPHPGTDQTAMMITKFDSKNAHSFVFKYPIEDTVGHCFIVIAEDIYGNKRRSDNIAFKDNWMCFHTINEIEIKGHRMYSPDLRSKVGGLNIRILFNIVYDKPEPKYVFYPLGDDTAGIPYCPLVFIKDFPTIVQPHNYIGNDMPGPECDLYSDGSDLFIKLGKNHNYEDSWCWSRIDSVFESGKDSIVLEPGFVEKGDLFLFRYDAGARKNPNFDSSVSKEIIHYGVFQVKSEIPGDFYDFPIGLTIDCKLYSGWRFI